MTKLIKKVYSQETRLLLKKAIFQCPIIPNKPTYKNFINNYKMTQMIQFHLLQNLKNLLTQNLNNFKKSSSKSTFHTGK
jgi:hypothetical protein